MPLLSGQGKLPTYRITQSGDALNNERPICKTTAVQLGAADNLARQIALELVDLAIHATDAQRSAFQEELGGLIESSDCLEEYDLLLNATRNQRNDTHRCFLSHPIQLLRTQSKQFRRNARRFVRQNRRAYSRADSINGSGAVKVVAAAYYLTGLHRIHTRFKSMRETPR